MLQGNIILITEDTTGKAPPLAAQTIKNTVPLHNNKGRQGWGSRRLSDSG